MIAVPAAGPMPGSTPTMRPTTTPINVAMRSSGEVARDSVGKQRKGIHQTPNTPLTSGTCR